MAKSLAVAVALPATTQVFDAATIYARQSGYIAQRMVDIGSRVKAGDLLAVISAPEVDDQLTQARMQLRPGPAWLSMYRQEAVIVPEEADTVRLIFTRYRELGARRDAPAPHRLSSGKRAAAARPAPTCRRAGARNMEREPQVVPAVGPSDIRFLRSLGFGLF